MPRYLSLTRRSLAFLLVFIPPPPPRHVKVSPFSSVTSMLPRLRCPPNPPNPPSSRQRPSTVTTRSNSRGTGLAKTARRTTATEESVSTSLRPYSSRARGFPDSFNRGFVRQRQQLVVYNRLLWRCQEAGVVSVHSLPLPSDCPPPLARLSRTRSKEMGVYKETQ